MKVSKISAEELINHSEREYNPAEWEKRVKSYLKYGNPEFFVVPAGDGYEYERFLVVYTLPEGIRMLGEVSYVSSLSSAGFTRAMFNAEKNEVNFGGVHSGENKNARVANNKEGRKLMAEWTKIGGCVWTNKF